MTTDETTDEIIDETTASIGRVEWDSTSLFFCLVILWRTFKTAYQAEVPILSTELQRVEVVA